ncbi:LutB/LldF family L-lactate oxidation iron-sulfur protein [Limnochorda pilosa]|uniref:Amino acid dehydrogenase n=1 Tax=Limnochorda pilosa TaxID=1555112 RepID=A0A0K2SQN3_LIMPI|nr:LutB/LldF family L-lactate oxidation iron-sulfur protein [Limnochorda pilosa]BAS29307.1 amino acid dehydrogenase [Limnochorda pilosa]
MTPERSRDLNGGVRTRARRALADTGTRQALAATAGRFRGARVQAAAEYGDFDALRDHGQALRAHTIEHLSEYLALLRRQVESAGGHVHFASTAREAVDAVMQVVRQRRARRVTKSKSMVSEEIELNAVLEAEGVRVVETDLGEYIIQLAHEPPFHIIAPALHKTRAQVADLFREQAGAPLPADPTIPQLNAFARERLREEFLQAEIGITGCNFAVAESGSVVLVTNEGNGRMQTTMPPVMITLMGMERVVPTWEDLGVLLELLARSATGQKLSSYTSVVTGPRREGEADGPEEFHLVIVDNGRSRMLGTEFQEALHCIRCGACLNACPVYQQIGGHAYGWVYSGPIGAVITPLMRGIEEWGELAQATSLCGACWEACPVRIPLHDYLVRIRQHEAMGAGRPRHPLEADLIGAWRWLMSRPGRYRRALGAGSRLGGPVTDDGHLKRAAGWLPVLSGWMAQRDFPAPARRPFRERWAQLERELYGPEQGPSERRPAPGNEAGAKEQGGERP